jgi:hypothetical protein
MKIDAALLAVRIAAAFGLGVALTLPHSRVASAAAGGCGAVVVFLDNSAASFLKRLKEKGNNG